MDIERRVGNQEPRTKNQDIVLIEIKPGTDESSEVRDIVSRNPESRTLNLEPARGRAGPKQYRITNKE